MSLNELTKADLLTYGDYAYDLIERGHAAAWDLGVNREGEPWALMLDEGEKVIWGVIRTRGWYVLMDYREDAISVSRNLTETLTALP